MMFKSKEISDSQFLNSATLSTLNETCNGIPKITSTPLNSRASGPGRNKLFLSPSAGKQGTPRRYSLSEASPSTSRQKPNVSNSHIAGPLLATLSFKDNVSMYEETKSSGLARRIVLYNDESEQERKVTHQEKYSSPGLFPVVHLFKKDPPLLEQSPKRVKIKLSTPERLGSHSPQLVKGRIVEEATNYRFQRQSSLPLYNKSNDEGTKSVLEALKEISRKRIHSNEEQDDTEDTGKRIRTELHNGSAATAKRSRADSPLLDTSHSPTPKPSQKKFCVYDEFAASKSSSDFSFLAKPEPLRSKRKTISTSTESLVTPKHVKVVNVETQTFTTVTDSKAKSNNIENEENSKKKECPLKVFDDAPLERIRKSRLAALMSNLAGKDAAIPAKSLDLHNKPKESVKPRVDSKLVNEEDRTNNIFTPPVEEKAVDTVDQHNKSLISILSPPKSTRESSPIKSDKHVQFNVTTNANSLLAQPSLTQTSTSIITPIVSDSINASTTKSKETSSTGASTEASLSLVSSLSQKSAVSSKSEASIGSNLLNTNASSLSKPLQMSASDTSSEKPPLSKPSNTSPNAGGFKFDLKSSSGSVAKSPTISFPISPSSSAIGGTSSTTMSATPNSAIFNFSKPSEDKKDTTATFGASNTNVVKSSSTSEPAFGFGGLSKSQSFNFGSTTATIAPTSDSKPQTSSKPGGFSFSSNTSTSKFGNVVTSSVPSVASSSPFTTTASSGFGNATFSFGASSAKTNSAFGEGENVSKAPTSFAFGASPAVTVTTSSVFGSTSNPTFGLNTTSSSAPIISSAIVPSFGNQTVPAFGSNQIAKSSTFGAPSTTTASVFGNAPATTASAFSMPSSSTPVFGNTMAATSSVFSTPSVSASAFGSVLTSTQSAFSPPSASVFGTPAVTTASVFNMPSTTASVFGSAPATTTASIFGSPPITTAPASSTTSVGFGSSNIPAFQSAVTTTSSDFGSNQSVFGLKSNATPVFGAANNKPSSGSSNVFGATTQASTFGSSNASSAFGVAAQPPSLFGSPSTTSSAPTFGSGGFSSPAVTAASNAPGFGTTTFSFGSNKPAANPFGSTTTSASNFGTGSAFSSTSGFGTSSSFGSTSSNAFGNTTSAPNTFGVTSAPAFNQAENKPAFAFGATETKTNSVFGSGTGSSAFGKPTNTQSGFGSSAGGFGSTNASGFNTQQNNGSFNFGSNAPSSSTPFGFGAPTSSTEPSKPSFNFTGGATNVPSFGGSSATPAFGAVAPNFGGSAPSFAATGSPATGVFNIGSGSSANGRHRTQLRAKRRT